MFFKTSIALLGLYATLGSTQALFGIEASGNSCTIRVDNLNGCSGNSGTFGSLDDLGNCNDGQFSTPKLTLSNAQQSSHIFLDTSEPTILTICDTSRVELIGDSNTYISFVDMNDELAGCSVDELLVGSTCIPSSSPNTPVATPASTPAS